MRKLQKQHLQSTNVCPNCGQGLSYPENFIFECSHCDYKMSEIESDSAAEFISSCDDLPALVFVKDEEQTYFYN